jgi:hypothetical protein
MHQNDEYSLQIHWMKLVLGFNIPHENNPDTLHRRPGLKTVRTYDHTILKLIQMAGT